jgi:hypothetical protein
MSPRPLLLVALLASACAPRMRAIALPYPTRPAPAPSAALASAPDAGAVEPVAATAELASDRRIEVALFVDGRRARPVAQVRDSGDRQVELIEADEPVEAWLRRGIEQELGAAGLDAVDREADTGAPRRLEGRLREAFATERDGTRADVSFHVLLRCMLHGEVLLSRTYSGAGVLPDGADGAPGEALGIALAQAARDLARDVARVPDCAR